MAENKFDFSGANESGASISAKEMESCFTCFLRTDDFIRIIEGGGENRASIFGQHFWFTHDEYYNRTVCNSCWARIDDFHRFYSEVKSAHLQPTKVEVKVEMLEEGEELNAVEAFPEITLGALKDDDLETEIFAEPLDDPFDSDCSEMEWTPPKKAKKIKERKTRSKKTTIDFKDEKQSKMDQQSLNNVSETITYAEPLDNPNDSDCADTEWEPGSDKPKKKKEEKIEKILKNPAFDCHLCHEEKSTKVSKYCSFRSLKKHSLKVHGKSPVMYCAECDQKYYSVVAFNRHSAKHRGIPVRTGKRKSRRKTLYEHSNIPPEEDLPPNNDETKPEQNEPLKPADGDEFFYYQNRYPPEVIAEQDALISKVVILACSLCDHIADTFANFRRHGVQMHGLTNVVMLCCQGRFNSRHSLYDHCVTHIDPDRFQCEPCGKKFRSSDRLKLHNWAIHTPLSERPHKCTLCSQAFVKEYLLAKHMTYHRNKEQKAFSCKECDLVFTQQPNLRLHRIKVHGEPTPWLCDICAEPFAQQGPLKKHRATHSPEELAQMMVQCEKCGKWLSNRRKYNTARHIKTCTGGGGKSVVGASEDGMSMWFGSSALS